VSVLELNFEKGWRGGERQTLYNLRGFRAQGVRVELICRRNSALETEAVKDGFIVYSFTSIIGVIRFLIFSAASYDFLHAQTSQILTYCVFTKFFHGCRVIFTRRVNFVQRGVLTKLKYRFTDKIIAISNPVKETLKLFTRRNDIEVISDIVVKSEPDIIRAKSFFSQYKIGDKKIIATVAAFTHEKDPITTLDAIRILRSRRDDFVFFHFGSGEFQSVVENKIKEFNLNDTYLIAGFHPNIEDFFSQFSIFVLSSIEEGLGSSVLDAFTNLVPVVATNAGGLQDLLSGGRGILCDKGDSQAIAAGIEVFLNDKEKTKACTEKAFHYVNQVHSMESVTSQYISWMKGQSIQK
jgi:glycosyltransferase involved in cell wall biosynthesis